MQNLKRYLRSRTSLSCLLAISCSQFAVGDEGVVLVPPLDNSAEVQIARRPWLLDVLTKKPESSRKSNPPTPPPNIPRVSDPPSMQVRAKRAADVPKTLSQQSPKVVEGESLEDDNWVPRARGKVGDLERLPLRDPIPLRDPESARPLEKDAAVKADASAAKQPVARKSDPPALVPIIRSPEPMNSPEPTNPSVTTSEPGETEPSAVEPMELSPAEKFSEMELQLAPAASPTLAGPATVESIEDESSADEPTTWEDSERSTPDLQAAGKVVSDLERFEVDETLPMDSEPEYIAQTPDAVEPDAVEPDAVEPDSAEPAAEGEVSEDLSLADRLRNARPYNEPTPSTTVESQLADEVSLQPAPQQRIASSRKATSSATPPQHSMSVGDQLDDQAVTDEPEPERVALDYVGKPTGPLRISASVAKIKNVMQRCLVNYYRNPEIANERSNWGMLHSIMVYGVDTKIVTERQNYSAIAWIAGNNACRGQRLLEDDRDGIRVKSGVGLQGHQAQMLCVFSLCNVPVDYPLYVGTTKYSVRDVVKREMADCKSGEELTFTLIALSHYLDTDESWIASDGTRWDCERLIREELSQPIVGAACGGTHRLMGFAHALRKRRAEGRPITGQWARAEEFTKDFVDYAFTLQNRDGSMSTNWFEGREDNGKMDRKVQTTGHIVEWLLTVMPDDQLQDPRLVRAVRYLLASMYNEPNHDWQIGPKGHALRALAMYYERTYRSGPAWQTPAVANGTQSTRR